MPFHRLMSLPALLRPLTVALAALATLAGAAPAQAAEPLKIGVIAPISGPFAENGVQIVNGIKTFMALHGDTVAGRKVEILWRDTTGPKPDVSKRLAQQLVVQDHVDVLTGFALTPEALGAAPIATQAKVPMVIMNAATSSIVGASPYIVRFSFTLAQEAATLASWSLKNGVHQVYIVVADYGPGYDAAKTFQRVFTAGGGSIVDTAKVPLLNPDFSPFVQRIKDAKPQAVFVFLPSGGPPVAFMKSFQERGLAAAGIKLIATGDVTDDAEIDAIGDYALGTVSTANYSAKHASPENQAFLAAYAKVDPHTRANFMAVGAYDSMNAIYQAATQLNGQLDGDKAVELMRHMSFMSPRGPISIDPATRDIVQTMYVRKVQKVDGKLYNIEFDKFDKVKDPG